MTERAIQTIHQTAKAQGLPVRAAYTARQAAAILGVGRGLVYELVHSGRVKTLRVGRRFYIAASELARLLEEGVAPAGQGGGR